MARVRFKFAIKCLFTALLLWLAFSAVHVGTVASLLSSIDPSWALVALLLASLIVLLDATLLSGVMWLFSGKMPFGTALLYSIVGWFFSNVAPSTVGGDVFRGVQLSRVGLRVGTALRVILAVRVLSFITLVAVIAAGFPIALQLLDEPRDKLLMSALLASGVGSIAGLLLLAHLPFRIPALERWPFFRRLLTIVGDFRLLLTPSRQIAGAWFSALAQHLLRVGVLAALAAGLSLNIPFATLFAFTTAALLMAMLPVSFGGWGIREVAFVYLLGAAGISAEAALSLSIAFGALRVLLGAIGGVAWLASNEKHFQVDAPSG